MMKGYRLYVQLRQCVAEEDEPVHIYVFNVDVDIFQRMLQLRGCDELTESECRQLLADVLAEEGGDAT